MFDPSATQVTVDGVHTALGSTPALGSRDHCALLGRYVGRYLCVIFSLSAHEYEGWNEPTGLIFAHVVVGLRHQTD